MVSFVGSLRSGNEWETRVKRDGWDADVVATVLFTIIAGVRRTLWSVDVGELERWRYGYKGA